LKCAPTRPRGRNGQTMTTTRTTTTTEILIGRQTSGPTGETTQSLRDSKPVDQPNDEDDMLGSESPWDPATMVSDARDRTTITLHFRTTRAPTTTVPTRTTTTLSPSTTQTPTPATTATTATTPPKTTRREGITGPLVGVRLECRILKSLTLPLQTS
jgi:hypothetical protein